MTKEEFEMRLILLGFYVVNVTPPRYSHDRLRMRVRYPLDNELPGRVCRLYGYGGDRRTALNFKTYDELLECVIKEADYESR